MKYVKKPIEVEAVRINKDCVDWQPDWFVEGMDNGSIIIGENNFVVHTLEGPMIGEYGSYVVKGPYDELYVVKGNIFEETYDRIGE